MSKESELCTRDIAQGPSVPQQHLLGPGWRAEWWKSEQKERLDDKQLGQMIKATAYLNPKWTSFKNEKLLRANRLKWGLGNGNPLQHSSPENPMERGT